MERFPISEREKEQNTNSIERIRGQSNTGKPQDHNHNREVIFALPSLRLHFKSEHLQGASTPDVDSGNDKIIPWMMWLQHLIVCPSRIQKNHRFNAVLSQSLRTTYL